MKRVNQKPLVLILGLVLVLSLLLSSGCIFPEEWFEPPSDVEEPMPAPVAPPNPAPLDPYEALPEPADGCEPCGCGGANYCRNPG